MLLLSDGYNQAFIRYFLQLRIRAVCDFFFNKSAQYPGDCQFLQMPAMLAVLYVCQKGFIIKTYSHLWSYTP